MQIFGQVWLWSLGSFLLGALFTWLLLVRPARRRLAELEDAGPRRFEQPTPTRIAEPFSPPGTNQTDRSLDDLFDTQKKPPPLPPTAPPAPSLFAPAPMSPAEAIQSRLEAGPVAPPEPPIQDESDTELSDNPFRQFAESTTVFEPPNLQAPPEVEPTGEDWFSNEDEADPHLVTDVEDDEQVDDSGTIFTQHTTPIPAEMIRSLDESQPQEVMAPSRHGLAEEAEPVAEEYEPAAETYQEPVGSYQEQEPYEEPAEAYEPAQAAYQPEPYRPSPAPRQPGVQTYEPATEIYEPAQEAYQPEPSAGRSLFEPVVPVAEAEDGEAEDFVPPGPFGPGSAMPLPGGGSPAPEFNVKASVTALRYCTQDNPQFDRIVAEVWFRTPSDAERVGFRVLS